MSEPPKFLLSARGVSMDVGKDAVRLHFVDPALFGALDVEDFTVAFDRALLPKDVFSKLDLVRKERGTVESARARMTEAALVRTLSDRTSLRLAGLFSLRLRLSPDRAAVTGRYLGEEGEGYFQMVLAPEAAPGATCGFRLVDARIYAGIPLPPLALADRFGDAVRGWAQSDRGDRWAADPLSALLPTLMLRLGLSRRPIVALHQRLAFEAGALVWQARPAPSDEGEIAAGIAAEDPCEAAERELLAGDAEAAIRALEALRDAGGNPRATLLLAEAGLARGKGGRTVRDPALCAEWAASTEAAFGLRARSLALQALLAGGRIREAAAQLDGLSASDPALPDGFADLATAPIRAMLAWSEGRGGEAREIFEVVLDKDPECFAAREALSEIYDEAGDEAKLAALYEGLEADLERLPPGPLPALGGLYGRAASFFDARGDASRAGRCRSVV